MNTPIHYTTPVGFSLTEAAQAARVTVVGGTQFFSDEDLASLRS